GRTYLIPGNDGQVTPAQRGLAGGAGPKVTVNIHNAPQGAEVTQRQGAGGSLDTDVIFKQMEGRMAQGVADGSSPLGSAMKGRYGLREMV
ncbi:MAG: phage tail tape measure protein, partial [Pseudomonadota bacterium]|nr:phage tail tape measure protein [Pseudomonadota bacterium]